MYVHVYVYNYVYVWMQSMYVYTDYNFKTSKQTRSMLKSINNVRALRLHGNWRILFII